MNNSRIHGSKRSARIVDTVRKRATVTAVASHLVLKLLVVHSRASVVISEACFTAVSGGGHDAA